MTTPIPQDELTSTVCGAVQQLTQHRKANFLLDTALALIDAGQSVLLELLVWGNAHTVFSASFLLDMGRMWRTTSMCTSEHPASRARIWLGHS